MSTISRKFSKDSIPSTDLRARRTRKWLQNALIELMKEKPFEDIQITEIAERAQVSRPAFYLHFRSKEDLLLSHVDMIFNEFHEELSIEIQRGNIDQKASAVMFFQYWERYADTLNLVIQADTSNILLERLKEYVEIMLNEKMPKMGSSARDPLRDYRIGFISGGAYMLLTQWILQKMPISAEKMGILFYELTSSCEKNKMQG
jgi:AcrR family transcriptional regulator